MSPAGPSLLRAPVVRSALVAAALLAAVTLGACSSGGASSADAGAAATAVGDTFHLPDDAMSCLQEQFAGNSRAAGAMTSTKELSDSQREAVAEVLETCVAVDQW